MENNITAKQLNVESILDQFSRVDGFLQRARLPFETGLLHERTEIKEVVLWELMKAREQLTNMIKEIGYPRFEPIVTKQLHYPPIDVHLLNTCPYCGDTECESDHK